MTHVKPRYTKVLEAVDGLDTDDKPRKGESDFGECAAMTNLVKQSEENPTRSIDLFAFPDRLI